MRGILAGLIASLFLMPVLPARADPSPTPEQELASAVAHARDTGWKTVAKEDGVVVLNRPVEGSNLREVRALTLLNASAERLFQVVRDYGSYPDFMPYVSTSREIRAPNAPLRVFQELEFPWPIANRHNTIRVESSSPGAGHHMVSWTLDAETPSPPSASGVALALNDGGWDFRQIADEPAPRTLVQYTVRTDPGGSLPAWAVNRANREAVPKVLRALSARAAQTP